MNGSRVPVVHDPNYVDWDAYCDAVYTPAPALTRLLDYETFWRTMGGVGWGFGGEIERQRAEAERIRR